MAKFQIPRGQSVGDKFIPAGSMIENVDGVWKIIASADRNYVGASFPGWWPGHDAMPQDQEAYDLMRDGMPGNLGSACPDNLIVTYVPGINRRP